MPVPAVSATFDFLRGRLRGHGVRCFGTLIARYFALVGFRRRVIRCVGVAVFGIRNLVIKSGK